MRGLRAFVVDAMIATVVVLVAAGLGIAFNLVSSRGIDPFGVYTGYGDTPLPSAEDPHPIPVVGIARPISVADARAVGGALLVDVRSAEEFTAGHIAGALSLPYSIMRMLPEDQGGGYKDEELAPLKAACTVLLYDAGDGSAETTHSQLREQLPVLRVIEGGVDAWKRAGGPWSGAGGGGS